MKKGTDKCFLADIAKIKSKAVIQENRGEIIKPIEYKSISFNIPIDLFWLFREYSVRNKNTIKNVFNDAIEQFLNNPTSINNICIDNEEKQKSNIKIKAEYIDKLKIIAINNRTNLTDIYISIIKSIV